VAGKGIPAQYLDGLSATFEESLPVALASWRRAEAAIYPSVMVNADLYQQYIQVVRAIANQLGDVRTEDELVAVWQEHRELGAETLARLSPSMGMMMDTRAVTDAAFCQRHREITREQGKEIARRRLDDARRDGDDWVVLFEDVTPFGSQRLEMHVRSGRSIHSSAQTEPYGPPSYELEVVQLDPRDGAWLLDKPPLMPARKFSRHDEWEARIVQARENFGKDGG
jgi:hypothetical protein